MAIAHPDKLAGFRIDGVDFGEVAPEVWNGGTKVALQVWYYRDGVDPVIQRGRVSPKPVKMEFKLTGPDALNNAMYLDSLAKAKEPVLVSWADLTFEAVIQDTDYTATQDTVQVSVEFVPVADPNPNVARLAAPLEFSPEDIFADIMDSLEGFAAMVDQAGKFFDNALQSLRDGLDEMESAITSAGEQLATVKRIADFPAQAAADIRDSLTSAADQMTEGVVDLVAIANASTTLPGEIVSTVTTIADTGNQASERVQYVAMLLAPPKIEHTLIEGQTVTDLADEYGITVAQLVDANPNLARENLAPGTTIEVPDAST